MARQRDHILHELRLANFDRKPLKDRLSLLLELSENDDDIADHAGQRLIEMYNEIKQISEENVENHVTNIQKWGDEHTKYKAHPVIKARHHQGLTSVSDVLMPLWKIVSGREEDGKLEELRRRFEQVSPVDWRSDDWLQKADRIISAYKEVSQELETVTWHVRNDQAEELKREIDDVIRRIEAEAVRKNSQPRYSP